MKKKSKLRWVRHRTAEGCMRAFVGVRDLAQIRSIRFGSYTKREKENPLEWLRRIRRDGAWGWYSHDNRTIHWWARSGAARRWKFEVLFHELMHDVVSGRGVVAHKKMKPFEEAARMAFDMVM